MSIRLIDIFMLGPFQLYLSTQMRNKFLKYAFVYIGASTIIYNLHNYMYFDMGLHHFKFIPVDENVRGKLQIHRLYNIFLMYPVMIYALFTEKLTTIQRVLLSMDITGGLIYNIRNFIRFYKYYKTRRYNNKRYYLSTDRQK
jgi:hypothetical protein